MTDSPRSKQFVEKIEVAGDQLLGQLNVLVRDLNARRVVIKDQHGRELISLPLNVSIAAGGLATLASPMLAAVGALAALVARVQLEVEREEPVEGDAQPSSTDPEPTTADPEPEASTTETPSKADTDTAAGEPGGSEWEPLADADTPKPSDENRFDA